jgi:DNA processing protein
MTAKERECWIKISAFPKIGPKRFALLLKYFGSVKKIWEAKTGELIKAGIDEKLVLEFEQFRLGFDHASYFLRMEKQGIRVITIEDKEYPENLKKTDSRPFLLYIIGQILPQDCLALGVVGTRKITSYGRIVTENLVSLLVSSGITIVSGLAYGVDSVAHSTALDNNGRTIGVWAGGLDSIMDGYRQNLVKRILKEKRGAVISEYPLGFNPQVSTFPQRNRIIAGMSLGVLVTEAAEDSGSLITAKFCQKMGRPVFSVPGPITSSMSAGTAKLLKEGAKLVFNVKDILDELDIEHSAKCIEAREILPDDKNEELILKILENEEKNIDQIIKETKKDSHFVASTLTLMEIKGKIKNIGMGVYRINK